MIVRCSNCSSAYSVDDLKVKGKKFAFECPKCATNVVIDNRTVSVPSTKSEFQASDTRGAAVQSAMTAAIAAAPQPKTAVAEDDFAMDSTLDSGLGFDSTASDMNGDAFSLDSLETDEMPKLDDNSEYEGMDQYDEDELEPEIDLSVLGNNSLGASPEYGLTDTEKDVFAAMDMSTDADSAEIPDLEGMDFEGLDEFESAAAPAAQSADTTPVTVSDNDDESITIDLDSIDLPLDEDEEAAQIPAAVQKSTAAADTEFDLDSLDMDNEEPAVTKKSEETEDESFTLDLNSLNIDIEDSSDIIQGETPEEDETISLKDFKNADESLTLDLGTLDLELDDTGEVMKGESPEDENGRLSIADAGLSFDELDTATEEVSDEDSSLSLADAGLSIDELESSSEVRLDEDEDLHLSVDDVEMDLDDIEVNEETYPQAASGMAASSKQESIADEYENSALPEIDLESLDSAEFPEEEKYLDIESKDDFTRYANDVEHYGSAEEISGSGYVNFSVDYSIKHSRLKAFLRLIGVYGILMIPHFLVLWIYSVLSSILGVINQLLVLASGSYERDFVSILEKTLRYALSISACMTGIIDEMPPFAGNRSIDYALQLSIARPASPSRLLAFLRLTGLGIIVSALPHLVILTILSFGAVIIGLFGNLIALITSRWPNFLFDFMVRYYRYYANVAAYLNGSVDSYPSFRFD